MTEKVFIYKDNKAILICPKCETSKTIDAAGHMDTNEAVMLDHKCSCGYLHNVLLERRKRYRKIVDLQGTYFHSFSEKQEDTTSMTIKEITRQGLSFKRNENSKQKFAIDDKLFLEFHLDNKSKSLIRKEAIIRNIRGRYIGVEFESVDLYDRALGQYMIS